MQSWQQLERICLSPLFATWIRKGGAYVIMLQQFRRALGVTAVRGMAKCTNYLVCITYEVLRRRLSILLKPIIVTSDGKLGEGEVVGILVIPLLGMLLMNSSVKVKGTTSARFRSVCACE